MNSFLMTFVVAVGLASSMALGADAGGAEKYYQGVSKSLDAIGNSLPEISKSATEASAAFVDDNQPMASLGSQAFVFESVGRCGGLMGLQNFDRMKNKATWKGIVLFAPASPDLDAKTLKLVTDLHTRGCLFAFFGSSDAADKARKAGMTIDWFVNNQVSGEEGLIEKDGKRVVPTSDAPNLIALWTWTGEFVAACTRQGKMPPMYLGFTFPGGRERAKKLASVGRFHDEKPQVVPEGVIGKEYLAEIRKSLDAVHASEMDKIRKVAAEALAAKAAGGACYCDADSHAIGHALDGPLDPKLFVLAGSWADDQPKLKPGDYVFALGYINVYAGLDGPSYADADRKAGAKLSLAIGGTERQAPGIPADETLIDEHWGYGDAVVQFPGYDIKVLPPSGVIQTAVYDMVCGEMLDAAGK